MLGPKWTVRGSWIDDCPDENAEIKIEVIENDIEPKTEPEIIDLPATDDLSEVCTNCTSGITGPFMMVWSAVLMWSDDLVDLSVLA